MGKTRTLMHDEISRTIKNDNGVSEGKIHIRLSYYEEFDDGQDEEGMPHYISNPYTRVNEHYTVTVEGEKGSIESETVFTGAALRQLVELFERLEPDSQKR